MFGRLGENSNVWKDKIWKSEVYKKRDQNSYVWKKK